MYYVIGLTLKYINNKSAGLANALRLTTSPTRMVLVCANIGTTQSVLLYLFARIVLRVGDSRAFEQFVSKDMCWILLHAHCKYMTFYSYCQTF